MSSVTFTIINETTVADEVMVVPQIAVFGGDGIIHDWRVLTPAPRGGSSKFIFAGQITAVVGDGINSTPATTVTPGSILPVLTVQNGGLAFGTPIADPSNPHGVGVRNESADPALLTVTWFLDSCALFVEDELNQQSMASLQLTPTFMFQARSASIVSPATTFDLDPTMRAVTVTWTRNGPAGADLFTFTSRV